MEDSKSVSVRPPAGQNEPPVFIGSQTQPSEPIGDKNRITSLAVFAGVEEELYDVMERELKSVRERPCAWVLGIQWIMKELN
jgi:hypothetical protein